MTMRVEDGWIDDDLYRKFMDSMPICTVDVLFFNREKKSVFLCKRMNEPLKGGYFSTGGRLWKNETFQEGVIHQTKEELGFDLNPERLVFGGVLNEPYDNSVYEGVGYHAVNIYWGYVLGEGDGDGFDFDHQHTECTWFDVDSKDLHPYIVEKISQLLSKL